MSTRISVSKKGYLVIQKAVVEEGMLFASSVKTGIVPIAAGADPEAAREQAMQYEWDLTGEPDNAGFYRAQLGAKIEATEDVVQ